jgi:acyl-CoA reductase-like NAD-dependent aldehyde dehydrogenase
MPSPRPWHSRHSHSASAGDAQLRTWSDGLACGVHTADIGRALRAMRSISADTVWINRYGRTSDFVIPTGGCHQSHEGPRT